MLIDQARIHVKAGGGGDGCTSFYRDRKVHKGKPNGGDGGPGGNIIFKVDKNIHTLLDFHYQRHFKASRGAHGGSNNKNGKAGADSYIKIPPGTIIKDAGTGVVLRDLTHPGEEVLIARGGEGGKGNSRKRDATSGDNGEEKDLGLELKIIADVGIIGYPNAGKSTLISRISNAKSKTASYAFTTKEPILGIVSVRDDNITFADMPGLIEGAHSGRGLGDEFLRHIERTKILLHLVDMAAVEGRDPYTDYSSLNNELKLYSRNVSRKTEILACNKMDLPGSGDNLKVFKEKVDKKIFPISAVTGEGVSELLDEVWRVFCEI